MVRAMPEVSSKSCPKCEMVKPVPEFGVRPNGKPKSYCRPCEREYNREHAARPEARNRKREVNRRYNESGKGRDNGYRHKYGIGVDEYDRLADEQQHRCAICGVDEPPRGSDFWCVDHDHDTGAVRGLLCDHCNRGLGQFKDDPERLLTAVRYLQDKTSA